MASTISVDKIKSTSGGAATFTLPTADGTAGQVIKTNASGVLSFTDADPNAGKGSDVTSADPAVIPTGDMYYDITGTTNFTAFTVAVGTHFFIQFDGILTMTHHATNLDLPGEANITTAAGDVAEFFAHTANQVQCVNYTRADGSAVKIKDESIDSDHYVDGSIDNAHIADDAIDSEHYADGSIDNAHIADDAIDSEHYADGSIDNAHIADDAIDSEHYATGSIDTAHIATNQIDETLIKDAFVADFTEVTVATGDSILLGDATDSGNTKRDTVQGVIDLVHGATAGVSTIWIPAIAMVSPDTNGAELSASETTATRPEIKVMDFDSSTREHAQFSIAMPKSWNEGTVTALFYWTHATAVATDVIWGIQGVCVSDNDTIDVAYGTAVVVTDTFHNAAEDLAISPVTAAITLDGTPAEGDLAYFQVYRDAAAAGDTTNSTDARLLGVKILFTTNAENDA